MSAKTDKFINTLVPIVRNEYLSRKQWVLPSVCIAQAALESGWDVNAKTLFGIKGDGYTATTSEYYNGHMVEITASFQTYPDLASAVVGYFDLITSLPRYAGAVNESDWYKSITAIKQGGYATDPHYVEKISSIIKEFELEQYDDRSEKDSSSNRIFEVGEAYTIVPTEGLNVRSDHSTRATILMAKPKAYSFKCIALYKDSKEIWLKSEIGWFCAKQNSNIYLR